MTGLRSGIFDVLVGVNLLREGLDLPEVQLVAIMDADKEGFLRSERSLTQTAGRAARNVNGMVIMYADTVTQSMQGTIDSTNERRAKQIAYNAAHGITPKPLNKKLSSNVLGTYTPKDDEVTIAAEMKGKYNSPEQIKKAVAETKKKMLKASKELDFLMAAQYRDEMRALERLLEEAQQR
jgi:excinuclease ABC subunit B